MRYRFVRKKDGHPVGDEVDLDEGGFYAEYWRRKRAIIPCERERELDVETREPEIEAQEIAPAAPPPPKRQRRKRK